MKLFLLFFTKWELNKFGTNNDAFWWEEEEREGGGGGGKGGGGGGIAHLLGTI